MGISNGLAGSVSLRANTAATTVQPFIASELAPFIEGLEFTTVAPGGFGDLACIVKVPDARLPRPELGVLSRVVLRDGEHCAFIGDWSDPGLALDGQHGDYLLLAALGAGLALREDPDDANYSATTPAAIIAAEMSRRSNYLALDQDQTRVLASDPGTAVSAVYDGANLEEILHDLCGVRGDYTWCVWDHPINRDAAGNPTAQLTVHARDTATVGFTAQGADIVRWRVQPSEQRCYNVVQVLYVDATAGPGQVTVTDTRLTGSGAQGSAPFRRRKLRKNLGKRPLTSAQATAIANALLSVYSNVSNKVEVELRSVRDARGRPIPLTYVRADSNLFIPELATRGNTLALGPSAGINEFYIWSTRYSERSGAEPLLTLELDSLADHLGNTLAAVKIGLDAAGRARGQYRLVASAGANETGDLEIAQPAGTTGTYSQRVRFGQVLPGTPSLVTLTQTSATNISSATATNLSPYGFTLNLAISSSAAFAWRGTYVASGV